MPHTAHSVALSRRRALLATSATFLGLAGPLAAQATPVRFRDTRIETVEVFVMVTHKHRLVPPRKKRAVTPAYQVHVVEKAPQLEDLIEQGLPIDAERAERKLQSIANEYRQKLGQQAYERALMTTRVFLYRLEGNPAIVFNGNKRWVIYGTYQVDEAIDQFEQMVQTARREGL